MSAPRYLLLFPRPAVDILSIAGRLGDHTGLRPVQGSSGTLLFCSDTSLVPFNSPRLAVVGHLFARSAPGLLVGAHGGTAETAWDKLLTDYWGGYIAVRERRGGYEILRDPSGALPCYYVSTPIGTAFASDAGTLLDAQLLMPAIDFRRLGHHLYRAGLPSQDTVLKGVREIPPGFSLQVGEETASSVWSPWKFGCDARDRKIDELAETLQATVQGCTSSWASISKRALIGVSGGLDSSAVSSCLAHTRIPTLAATLFTDDPQGDERRYARILAEHLHLELIEMPYAHGDIQIDKSASAHLPRPIARTQALAHDAAMLAIMKLRNIDAFFTGNGGDNVFCSLHSARPLVDRLLTAGPGLGFLRSLRDICRLTGCNPVQAIRSAMAVWSSSGRGYRWRGDDHLLSRDVANDAAGKLHHPWLEVPRHGLPGKAAHISLLLRAQMTLEGFDRHTGPMTINPLMAQPVMELCLEIPSWQWRERGIDRAVARKAFQRRLPAPIIARREKGGPDGFSVEILIRNRAEISDRLLDGRMAEEGLLDRGALQDALRDKGAAHGLERVRILSLLDTEAWIRQWLNRSTSSSKPIPKVNTHLHDQHEIYDGPRVAPTPSQ